MGCSSLLKSFSLLSFLLSFMACDKNCIFLIFYATYRMSSRTTCLIRHSHIYSYRLAGIVVNHGLDLINKLMRSFLLRTIRVMLQSCSTFVITIGLIQFFLNPLQYPHIDTSTQWNCRISNTVVNSERYSMLFSNFWRSVESWYCFPYRQRPIDSRLRHSRQNLKQSAWAK